MQEIDARNASVALRMESVGRNLFAGREVFGDNVALRMESVGRNFLDCGSLELTETGRSPHGERG